MSSPKTIDRGADKSFAYNHLFCAVTIIAIKRTAIPLFGKTIPNNLMRKIILNKVKEIYLCLDKDALKDALIISEHLMNSGIRVGMVDLPNDSDPSSIGFEGIHSMLNDTDELTLSNLMRYKLWQ